GRAVAAGLQQLDDRRGLVRARVVAPQGYRRRLDGKGPAGASSQHAALDEIARTEQPMSACHVPEHIGGTFKEAGIFMTRNWGRLWMWQSERRILLLKWTRSNLPRD